MRRSLRRSLGLSSLGFAVACAAACSGPAGDGSEVTPDDDSAASGSGSGAGEQEITADRLTLPRPRRPGSSGGSSRGSSGSSSGASKDAGTTSDAGAKSDASSGGGSSGGASPSSTFLPVVQGTCPTIASGMQTFGGQQVQIWAASSAPTQPAALVIFWYGTGGSSSDATFFFGQAQINAVTASGGIVAAVSTSTKSGTNTGDNVWYTGDFNTTDQVVACAIQQHRIDPSRIYSTGDSAGGLQATWMAYARSGYLAAVAPISGGLTGTNGFYLDPTNSPQDPSNVPSAIVTHGALGKDVVGIDFAAASAAYEADIARKGGASVDCNTGGGHVSGPPQISPAIWQFFEDHPFKTKQDYASGLPAVFPSYCRVGPRAADGGVE